MKTLNCLMKDRQGTALIPMALLFLIFIAVLLAFALGLERAEESRNNGYALLEAPAAVSSETLPEEETGGKTSRDEASFFEKHPSGIVSTGRVFETILGADTRTVLLRGMIEHKRIDRETPVLCAQSKTTLKAYSFMGYEADWVGVKGMEIKMKEFTFDMPIYDDVMALCETHLN